MSPTPVWFITAASSGFGHEMVLDALKLGHIVVATARNPARIQDLADAGADTLAFDVTSPLSTMEDVAAQVFAKYGRVDYLINTAGYILEGAVEEVSAKETYDCFNTNVFGAMNTMKAFFPSMRQQEVGSNGRRATVVTFGSLGSWQGGAGCSVYSMTKFSASALAESLAIEMAPFKIAATVIEPGYFRTGFLSSGSKQHAAERIAAYADESTPTGQFLAAVPAIHNNQPGDVKKGSKVAVQVLTGTGVAEGKPLPVRIVLGSDCEQTIRKECTAALALLDEWKDVIRSTDYPKGE